MNTERKYRKQLNRNGWMTKIQRFVWGNKTPKFIGYCPFFWFTWFSLLAVPLALILFALALPFVAAVSLISKIPKHPKRPNYEVLLDIYTAVQAIAGNLKQYEAYAQAVKDDFKWAQWICATPDWWNCVLAAHSRDERLQAKRERRGARDAKHLSKVANNLHYIVRPVIYLFSGFVLFKLGQFLYWSWPKIYWPTVGQVAIMLLGGIIIAAAVYFLIQAIESAWRFYRRHCPKCPSKHGFWSKFNNALCTAGEFLSDTVEAIYTRECPLIEWSDESAPIERMDE